MIGSALLRCRTSEGGDPPRIFKLLVRPDLEASLPANIALVGIVVGAGEGGSGEQPVMPEKP